MKIIIDAMGGDNAPRAVVEGAVRAAKEYAVDIILTGRGEEILRCMEELGCKDMPRGIEVANASEVVEMEDDPATVTRVKKDSSMTVGLRMLHDGQADAMISAGSTGALLSGATLIVKRIKGIRRAAMAPLFPNDRSGVLLVDCGANVECTSEYLLQFAYMGSYYMKSMCAVENPRVGIVNIGVEATKGGTLQRETYELLKQAASEGRINFVGNVEARDIMFDCCEVAVCDGFSGNILLKGIEGTARFMARELKGIFTQNTRTRLAGALVGGDIRALKRKLDPSEVGGTALLGISKPVIKAHGSSDARAICNAVRQAVDNVNAGLAKMISDNIEYMRLRNESDAPDREG